MTTPSATRVLEDRYTFASISEFLLGRPNRLQIPGAGSDSNREWRSNLFGLFVQDNLEISRRVTLNLGLRYEFITVSTELDGKVANLRDPARDPATTVGDPLFENPSLLNFAPRVGFAWDVMGDGKTSVRGGFGIYYDQMHLGYQSVSRIAICRSTSTRPSAIRSFRTRGDR